MVTVLKKYKPLTAIFQDVIISLKKKLTFVNKIRKCNMILLLQLKTLNPSPLHPLKRITIHQPCSIPSCFPTRTPSQPSLAKILLKWSHKQLLLIIRLLKWYFMLFLSIFCMSTNRPTQKKIILVWLYVLIMPKRS